MYEWRLDEIIVLKMERQENWSDEGEMDCYGGLPFRFIGSAKLDYVTKNQVVEGEAVFGKNLSWWYFKKCEVDIPKTKLLHELLERWN